MSSDSTTKQGQIVIGGKTMVRSHTGTRGLVEVVVKKAKPPAAPTKAQGRAHVSNFNLHKAARGALRAHSDIRNNSPVENHQKCDFETPYAQLNATYSNWQSTRIGKDGVIETDAYAEYAGLMLMAKHIARSSVLLDADPEHKVPQIRCAGVQFSPTTLIAVHAINLALKINDEVDNPPAHVLNSDTMRAAEFISNHDMRFAVTMLMRNCEGTAAAPVLISAMQRLNPDFDVEPVKSDIKPPETYSAMMRCAGPGARHRNCT